MQYRVWFVYDRELGPGAWWPFDEDALDYHILGYLEEFPGEFYDIEIV
jgi:hypothetical protein